MEEDSNLLNKTQKVGEVVSIVGPVVDVSFFDQDLPSIYTALEVVDEDLRRPQEGPRNKDLGKPLRVILEVMHHLGNDTVRCIAMSSTDGLVRGMKVINTEKSMDVPVGEEILGRVFNVLGEPIDDATGIQIKERWPIHRRHRPLMSRKLEKYLKPV